MHLAAPARITDVLPWPPMKTVPDALVGLERGIAAAGVAAHDPTMSEPAHLREVAGVVREAAAIIERSISTPPERSLPTAVANARLGADLLDRAAVEVERSAWDAAATAADAAYDTLVSAFTLAGGS